MMMTMMLPLIVMMIVVMMGDDNRDPRDSWVVFPDSIVSYLQLVVRQPDTFLFVGSFANEA